MGENHTHTLVSRLRDDVHRHLLQLKEGGDEEVRLRRKLVAQRKGHEGEKETHFLHHGRAQIQNLRGNGLTSTLETRVPP